MRYEYGCVTLTCDTDIDEQEAHNYIEHYQDKFDGTVKALDIHIDGDHADVTYTLTGAPQPFERIRRITGYLVGTLDRFNDGKRAEESERVKHTMFWSSDKLTGYPTSPIILGVSSEFWSSDKRGCGRFLGRPNYTPGSACTPSGSTSQGAS